MRKLLFLFLFTTLLVGCSGGNTEPLTMYDFLQTVDYDHVDSLAGDNFVLVLYNTDVDENKAIELTADMLNQIKRIEGIERVSISWSDLDIKVTVLENLQTNWNINKVNELLK